MIGGAWMVLGDGTRISSALRFLVGLRSSLEIMADALPGEALRHTAAIW